MLFVDNFDSYKERIRSLPLGTKLTKSELLSDAFLIERQGKVEMYYAPHNEFVNPLARIAIIGITPGWTQMELAFRQARADLAAGLPTEQICKNAKMTARLAGSMRKNLVGMLDELDLNKKLHIPTCDDLFIRDSDILHTTSMLRYPVFVEKMNYTGHRPPLNTTSSLREFAVHSLQKELSSLNHPLLIPLGKTVEAVLRYLVTEGFVDPLQCLWGFPHPSGANGSRKLQFKHSQSMMRQTIAAFRIPD